MSFQTSITIEPVWSATKVQLFIVAANGNSKSPFIPVVIVEPNPSIIALSDPIATAEVPDVPDEPLEPDVPRVPDEPLEPDVPDEPLEPDVPDEPDEPDVPRVPDEPDDPDVPDEPLEPDVPDEPLFPL